MPNHRLAAAVKQRQQRNHTLEARLDAQDAQIKALTEALVHGERHKSEFLSTMSHELRTPLNVVLGFASLIYDEAFGPLNTEQQDACGKVLESAERLTLLVNNLLDAAKLDRGTLQFDLDTVDLAAVTRMALAGVEAQALAKGLTIEANLPTVLPAVRADADRLQQVIGHLLDNAMKFTASGGRIGMRSTAEAVEGVVVIEVWDTGIGIPSEALHRLFERFYQVDSSNTREYGGTGIGLAIVKEFVQGLGGDVGVESHVGRGSTFRLILPTA